MTHYSTSDLSRKSGDIIAEALRRPVTITQRNKPRLVLLSIEDYRKLTARADTRKAGRLETMPDDLFEGVKEAASACGWDPSEVEGVLIGMSAPTSDEPGRWKWVPLRLDVSSTVVRSQARLGRARHTSASRRS